MGASYPTLATSIVIGRYVYWHEGKQEEGDILGYHARKMLAIRRGHVCSVIRRRVAWDKVGPI